MNTVIADFDPATHYAHVSRWWAAHSWPIVPLSHLPATGLIVAVDDELAAAAWIYKTDSAFCLLEWIVANPNVRRERRASALDLLIERAKSQALELGFSSIFISARSQPLISRLHKHGFSGDDAGMTNLIFNLTGGS